MKYFKKVREFKVEMYSYTVFVAILTEEGCKSLLKKDDGALTIRIDHNICVYLKSLSVSTLMHELFHVTEFIMDGIGQKMSENNNNETWAYLIGYLTKKSLGILNGESIDKIK